MKPNDLPDLRHAGILALRLDSMGDVVMTGPALRQIKAHYPESHLTLLTSESGAMAGRHLPAVDRVLARAVPWMKGKSARWEAPLDSLVAELRQARFDAAIIFTVYSQNPLPAALLCTQAGIPVRLAHCRENPYDLLSHWVPEREPETGVRHEVRRQLDLAEVLTGPLPDAPLSLAIAPYHRETVAPLISAYGDGWFVLHPGASAASRRYPPGQYAEVIAKLYDRLGLVAVLTGSEAECPLVEAIREEAACPTVSLAGQLDFPELAALIGLAPLIICNNTGPSHVAAAMQTPVICLYALTNPQHTPWQVPSRVLYRDVSCRYCYRSACAEPGHPCLSGVSSEEVVNATLQLLSPQASLAL